MFKNYFKVAIKVLQRNRFYTFISLFGISFTLMVLMLTTAFFQNELGKNKPLTNKDRILFIPIMALKSWKKEIKLKIDTSYIEDKAVYDTTRTETPLVGQQKSYSSASLGMKFIKKYILSMKSPDMISVFSAGGTTEVYPNNKKLELKTIYTDANYWKIFDFTFKEGQPYSTASVDNQAREIVISIDAAEKYFGKHSTYLGKEMAWGNQRFTVIGVTEPVNTSIRQVKADIYTPYTHIPAFEQDYGWAHLGSMNVALLGKNANDLAQISAELRHVEKTVELPIDGFDALLIFEKDLSDMYAWGMIGTQENRYGKTFILMVLAGLILFLLIPTLNLINLNVTRIMERSSEIGVRKAFGARTRDLLIQFLFENIIITIIGGIIGFILAFFALQWINSQQIFENTYLQFNTTIFALSLLIVLLFGISSGLIPAWRMARTQVAKAIKQNTI